MKDDKPFIMNKNNKKIPPALKDKDDKQVLDIEELLVDKSNKTMILDLSEIEFEDNDKEESIEEISVDNDSDDDLDDEKTEDISGKFKKAPDKINSLEDLADDDDKPEMDLDDLLEEATVSQDYNAAQDKTVMISIEDIIETPPVMENNILDDDILEETLESVKPSTDNTFISSLDEKIASSNNADNEYKRYMDELEEAGEKLLDYVIYGKLNEFEKELEVLMDGKESNILDLIKYLFEFYVKKDD